MMRAKTIFETISFQRYKDPKEALGLKLEPELVKQDKYTFYNFKILDYFYVLVSEELIEGVYVWNIYFKGRPGNKTIREVVYKYISGYEEDIDTLIENAKKIILDDVKKRMIKESISFQRYKDPKTALGLDPFEEIVNEIRTMLKNIGIELGDIHYDSKTKVVEINLRGYHYIAKEDAKKVIDYLSTFRMKGEKVFFVCRYNNLQPEFIKIDLKEATKMHEAISFQRYKDPKKALGLSIDFHIEEWLDKMDVKNYIINDDHTINVNKGIVDLEHKLEKLSELPDYIQFNNVPGSFYIGYNNLTSLKGCPLYVKSAFACSHNKLISLEYIPKSAQQFVCLSNRGKQFTIKDVLKYCDVNKELITL